eukprot:TRINITY_DN10119_c1_g1_i1.p1 TRINITY_DN10119_c1_g1~~TRINITY_DN10119_c1_g1_i1.p1  ORF type:complete len:322 (-),score=121.89 TRINITY_DN10119_c1_g1_i1:35-1000(-)
MVHALKSVFKFSYKSALFLFDLLIQSGYVVSLTPVIHLEDESTEFGFMENEGEKILNRKKSLNEELSAAKIGELFSSAFEILILKHVTQVELVNFRTMGTSPEFVKVLQIAEEFYAMKPEDLNFAQKKAFFLNCYNLLLIHSQVLHELQLEKSKNFYLIMGEKMDLQNIHDKLCAHDRTRDQSIDPRLHFAASNFANTKLLKSYNEFKLNSALRDFTSTFLEERIRIAPTKSKVILPKLVSVYRDDFPKTNSELLQWISERLEGEKREKINRIIESRCDVHIKFKDASLRRDSNPPIPTGMSHLSPIMHHPLMRKRNSFLY